MTTSDVAPVRLIGRIPVRNLWLLTLYASELYRELPRSDLAGAEDNPDDLPKLLAELLTRAVERRMRRNLSLDYRRRQADLEHSRSRTHRPAPNRAPPATAPAGSSPGSVRV